MSLNLPRHSQVNILATAAFIGSLALALAAGLAALGLSGRANAAITGLIWHTLQQSGPAEFPKALPDWGVWIGTAMIAYGLAFAMLGVPGTWRRVVLWVTTLILVAAWAPVLGLAAHAPQIASPIIAVLWSGACSLVYAYSHRMPSDELPDSSR